MKREFKIVLLANLLLISCGFVFYMAGVAKVVLKKGKAQLFKDGSPMVYNGAVENNRQTTAYNWRHGTAC